MRKFQEGEMLSFTNYFKVVQQNSDSLIVSEVKNSNKTELITIEGKDLLAQLVSADYYESTIKLTKAQMIDTLLAAGDKVVTVNFTKQDGTIRTLRGTNPIPEVNLGRTQIIDLEVLEKNPQDKTRGIRLVDNRAINFVVLENVMYITK
jgi:hypothetical protein